MSFDTRSGLVAAKNARKGEGIRLRLTIKTGLAGAVRLLDRGKVARSCGWNTGDCRRQRPSVPNARKAKQSVFRGKNCQFDENYSLFQFTGNLLVTL
jgi:hypothetical protein